MVVMKKTGQLLVLAALLQGCTSTTPTTVVPRAKAELVKAIQETSHQTAVPNTVTEELLAAAALPAPMEPVLPRFNVAADNVAAPQFLAALVADSDFSVMVHPAVSGTISLQLKQVTVPQVMQLLRDMYGYDIRRQGQVFQVAAPGLRTETIAVNYLMLQRSGLSSVTVNSGGVSEERQNNNNNQQNDPVLQDDSQNTGDQNEQQRRRNNQQSQRSDFNGSMVQSQSQTSFWDELSQSLQLLLGDAPGRVVSVSPQAGLVTIRAMPDEIAAIRQYLQQSESHLQRQVILEARIIEVTLNDDYQQGINWQNALANIESTRFNITTSAGQSGNLISNTLGGLTNITFQNADFNGVISLLSTQGDAQVLSSPRVTAMNNQKAVIKVGQDEYFVTRVSSNNTIANGVQQSSPSVTVTPFFSGIALDVTPQIDQNGQVILHVHPSVTETSEKSKTIRLAEQDIVLPLAQSNIRESDTIIRANNGEIVVIGGLMQTILTEQESGVPGLRALPVLGHLFKSSSKVEKKKELVILLRPTVTDAGVWREQLNHSDQLLQEWSR